MFGSKDNSRSLTVIEGGQPPIEVDAELQLMADSIKKIYLHMQKPRNGYTERQLKAASTLAFQVDNLAQELGLI